MDEAEAERCPQEKSLKVVLRSLGIPEAKLQGDLQDFPGVEWSLWQCNKKTLQDFWDKKVRKFCVQDLCLGSDRPCQTPRFFGDSCAVLAIDLPGRDLGGALHPEISKLAKLRVLDLDGTNITGSLEVLANNTWLEYLSLRHTRVGGRLEALSKAKDLSSLDLTGTKVTGDVAALANATNLRHLRLSNMAVFGELKFLAKMKDLKKLDLANLKVVGDAAVMAKWSFIEQIDLSGTQVEFDLFQQFEPYNRTEEKWQCKWPALRFLDVSRTPQFSPAQDLLRPFAGCGKLATLKAAGCGLSGPLWPEIVYLG